MKSFYFCSLSSLCDIFTRGLSWNEIDKYNGKESVSYSEPKPFFPQCPLIMLVDMSACGGGLNEMDKIIDFSISH